MKKLVKYFAVPLTIMFAFIMSVNAEICGGVKFKEERIYEPIGRVPVRVCLSEREGDPKPVEKGPFLSPTLAMYSCETTYTTKLNKHKIVVHIGPCGEEQVKVDWVCTYTKSYPCCTTNAPTPDAEHCTDNNGVELATYKNTCYEEKTKTYKNKPSSTCGSNSECKPKTMEEQCKEDTGFDCECDGDVYLRYEYRPVYCEKSAITTVFADGQQFSTHGEPAFCINPSYLVPEKGSTWDDTFEVTKCENARSSKDCGYANILIEGDRLGYSYGVIATAIRLWGADETFVYDPVAGGFDDTGLPIYESHSSSNIRNFQEKYINIYKNTIKHIDKYLKSGQTIETVKSPNDLKQIACPGNTCVTNCPGNVCVSNCTNADAGVMCGINANWDYLNAIYLYINTVQGNPYMLEHLYEKLESMGYDTGEYSDMVDARITNYNETENIVEITEILEQDVEVDCDALDEENKEYCRMPKQKIYMIIDGKKVLIGESDGTDYYKYCKKNRCIVEVQPPVALCDKLQNTKTKTIIIEYDVITTFADRVVKKFVGCSSTSSDKEQIMFVYDLKDDIGHHEETEHHEDTKEQKEITIKYVCKCDDNQYDGPDVQAYGAGDYDKAIIDNDKLATYSAKDSGLNNVCGNINENGSYSSTNKYLSGPYDTITKSSVFEPSLAKVLNMCREGKKDVYDYSDYYGVNSKVCKIYCRDEVDYLLANKTKVDGGLTFKYDITMRLKENKNMIPNQVKKGKNYEYYLVNGNSLQTLQTNSSNPKLLTSVVIEQRECVADIFYNKPNSDGKKWSELYSEAHAQGEQKQLIYDLENCNLFLGKNSNGSGHKVNVDVVVQAINISDDEKYTTMEYLTKSVKSCNEEGNCPTMRLAYEDANGENVYDMAMETGVYVSGVSYCNNDGNSKCYEYYYDSTTKTAQDRLGGSHNFKTTSVSVKGTGNVTIPTNDYATFTINKEYDFYNNTTKYTKVGNGDITTEEGEDRLELEKYSYPTSADTTPGSYSVKHKYTLKSSLFRKTKNDDFSKLVKKLNDYSCYIDISNKTKKTCTSDCCDPSCNPKYSLGYTFKNVEADNLFPSAKTDDTWKSQFAINWDNPRANQIQEEIEEASSKYFTTGDFVDFSIKLMPKDIQTIQKYNKDNNSISSTATKGYLNNTLYNCEVGEDGVLLNCKSTFVSSIRKGEFGFTFTSIGGNN